MKEKEKISLGINLSMLMDSFLTNDNNPESVANTAIDFCRSLLKEFPEISEVIEQVFENYEPDDIEFQEKWDRHMAFLRFIKQLN